MRKPFSCMAAATAAIAVPPMPTKWTDLMPGNIVKVITAGHQISNHQCLQSGAQVDRNEGLQRREVDFPRCFGGEAEETPSDFGEAVRLVRDEGLDNTG